MSTITDMDMGINTISIQATITIIIIPERNSPPNFVVQLDGPQLVNRLKNSILISYHPHLGFYILL